MASFVLGGWGSVAPLPVLLGVAWFTGLRGARDVALVCTIVATACTLLPIGVSMPGLAAGLTAYALLLWAAPGLRPEVRWLTRGTVRPSLGLIAATAAVSGTALVVWYLALAPNMAHFAQLIPTWAPAWAIPFGVLVFSGANAAAEELVFRGTIMQGTDRVLGPGVASIVIQGAAFGIWHLHGFPSGATGALMVTSYGIMLGFVRRKSGGLLAPWIAHVFADVTILTLLWLLP